MTFHFSEPWYKSRLWGQADDNNPCLSPALHNRKSHLVKFLNEVTPALPRPRGDNQKVITVHLSPAIQQLSP